MTSDGRLPIEQRRNYKNVADALWRITKEEGVFALWKGATPVCCNVYWNNNILDHVACHDSERCTIGIIQSSQGIVNNSYYGNNCNSKCFWNRATLVTMSQHTLQHHWFLDFWPLPCPFQSSMLYKFCITQFASMAKTRIQNQKTQEYKNTIDVIVKVARNEGVLSLWKG